LMYGISFRRILVSAGILLVVIVAAVGRKEDPAVTLLWSPYYRIEVRSQQLSAQPKVVIHRMYVNRDFHQVMLDVSDEVGRQTKEGTEGRRWWNSCRLHYDLPYHVRVSPRTVLIAGAGSGNDAAAALRNHAGHVTAVEIDPVILALGRKLHPERPYDSGSIRVVQTDIRSFLRRSHERFDLIVYSVLDSHTALSSLSSLRLENYVYTVEGIREAVTHLNPDGVMCVSFYVGSRGWLGDRLYRVIELGAGERPVWTKFEGRVYYFFGPGLSSQTAASTIRKLGLPVGLHAFTDVQPSTDDWPFLYSSPKGQPWVYYLSLVLIVVCGMSLVWWTLRGRGSRERGMDWPMFFLGAGFLLIETKALAELSLLFGSTWVVNTFVFAGIFIMVLLSILAVHLGAGRWLRPAFGLLAASLIAWYVFPKDTLNALEFWPRAVVGTVFVSLPVLFAGIVFSTLFARRSNPSTAFGSNLIGAVVGGAAEAASLAWGIRSLTLLALGFYAVAWIRTEKGR